MKRNFSFLVVILSGFIVTTNFSCTKFAEEQPEAYDIAITDTGCSVPNITISRTLTWVWQNTGTTAHTITSDDGVELNSPNILPGKTFPPTFRIAGTFNYHCTIHPSEKATIVVHP